MCAYFEVVGVLFGRAGTLTGRDVEHAARVKTEVGVAKRAKGHVVLQILNHQEVLSPVGAFERLVSPSMVGGSPSLKGQASVRPYSPQSPSVNVRHDQVAVGRERHLLRAAPPCAIHGQLAVDGFEQFRHDQLRPPFPCRPLADILHARSGQGWVQRHDRPQILASPVEDPHFGQPSYPSRIEEHKELPLLLVNCKVPDETPRMRIALEQEPLQFQFHFARRARVSGAGAKLNRLRGVFGRKQSSHLPRSAEMPVE